MCGAPVDRDDISNSSTATASGQPEHLPTGERRTANGERRKKPSLTV